MNTPHSSMLRKTKTDIHSIIYGTIRMSGFAMVLSGILSLLFFTSSSMRAEAATTIKTATTSSSLVGWWTFDDASSTTATDFSGYGNTGTIACSGVGCIVPTFVNGKRGKALDFSSNGTYYGVVSLPSTVPVASANQVTVSTWYYNKGGGGDPRIITRNWCTAGSWLMHVTLGFGVTSAGGCAGQVFASFGAMNANQWYLLTGVFDGTTVYSYKNGVRISTAAAGTVDISANAAALAMMTGNNGYLDDMRIYNRALSATEVAALYRSGQVTATPANKSGLVSYWPMNEGTSTSAGDFSGYRNNFTLTNFANVASSTSGWNTGKKGKALTFDGIDDYANIPQPNIQTSPNVFTISGWIYPENQYARFLTPTSNGIDQWVGYDNTNQRLELTITEIADVNNRSRYSTTGSVPLNRWTHWTISINDKEIRMYINGVLDSSYTEVIDIGAWNLTWTLGQRGNSTSWFKGRMDELRVYNRILTLAEVKAVYKANETSVNTSQNTKITDGLIGYWSFNGPDIDNTHIYDRSVSADHAYLVGSVSTSSVKTIGKVGQGMNFTGANYYANATSTVGNITTNQVTVAGWVYPYSTGSIMTLISNDRDCGGCGSYKGYGLQMYYGGTTVFRIWNDDGTGPRSTASANNPAANEWTHLAGTFDGTTIRLYKNGVQISSSTSVGNGTLGYPATFDTKIGQLGCCSGTHTMNGKIDEVRVYSRALTATEIKQLYLMGK